MVVSMVVPIFVLWLFDGCHDGWGTDVDSVTPYIVLGFGDFIGVLPVNVILLIYHRNR